MAILTHMCPHCGTDRLGMRVVAATTFGTDWVAYLQCPKCNLPAAARCRAGRSGAIGSQTWASHGSFHGDFLESGWAIVDFWPAVPKPLIPELLPPDIERVYMQAERNFPTAGNEEAAGIMYGKALDIGLKKIDPGLSGMLGPRIKKLAEAGKLTSDIAEWSGRIRDIRNDATHEETPITRGTQRSAAFHRNGPSLFVLPPQPSQEATRRKFALGDAMIRSR
jgi:hypothetical protein